MRTSIERKKRLQQTIDCGEWGYTFGIKKILWRRKQKTIKEKRSGEWGHLLREKKTTTNKRLWWVRTHFWDEKKSLEMVSEDILWREKQKTIKEKGSGEWGHLWRKKRLLQTWDCDEWGQTFGMEKNY